jgi:hypothetical protein
MSNAAGILTLIANHNNFFLGGIRYSSDLWINPPISRVGIVWLYRAFWPHRYVIPQFFSLTRHWETAFFTGVWTSGYHRALTKALLCAALADREIRVGMTIDLL